MPRKRAQSTEQTEGGRLSDMLMQKMNKHFGAGTITAHGRDAAHTDYISTQCFALDTAIGRPGIPCGRLTVIQGAEAGGKTTIATQILAECQRRGGLSVYLDAESAFDVDHAADLGLYDAEYVERKGLDVEPLLILYPEHIKDAFQKIEYVIKTARELDKNRLVCIVWDSVAATPTSEEAEDDTYDSNQPGLAARQVSKGLRRLIKIVADNNIALICINQEKEKIATGFGSWGDKTATIAQKPLGFHATVRLVVTRIGFARGKRKHEARGITTLVKVAKNKIAPPHREATFDIMYASGIDNEGCMLSMAKDFEIVRTSGSYLGYGDCKFRSKDWPNVDCYNEIITELKAEVEREQAKALGKWKAEEADEVDEEEEEEDE